MEPGVVVGQWSEHAKHAEQTLLISLVESASIEVGQERSGVPLPASSDEETHGLQRCPARHDHGGEHRRDTVVEWRPPTKDLAHRSREPMPAVLAPQNR